jgi:hypothetical protein
VIGRILWLSGLVTVALLTIVLQLDFMSRRSPGIAELVPGPFRNHAQTQIAKNAVQGDDAALALAETERLVRRRPLPAESLTLLAIGQAKAGKTGRAARTIQMAGQRGWRDPIAQEAVLRLALQAGDQPEAARRYAALFLRAGTPDRLLEELGPRVLGAPGGIGQETMAAIVVGGERWHRTFLQRGAKVMPPLAFSEISAMSLLDGAAFDCAQLGQSLKTLELRNPGAAGRLGMAAAGRCPKLAPAGTFPL